MVSSELGIGTLEGWISGGLWLLDTAIRGEVSWVHDVRFGRSSFAIAEIESKRRMLWGDRTRFGVPSSTLRLLAFIPM